MSRNRNLLLIFVIILLCNNLAKAQDKPMYMWTQISPEIRLNIENTPFEFRFKPDEHTFTSPNYIENGQVGQTDLLAGVNFWKCKFFSYTKFDYEGGAWTGARLDFTHLAMQDKLVLHAQARYFFPLNDKSSQHGYFIQYAGYQFSDTKSIGLLGLGKWNKGDAFTDGLWFVGPNFALSDTKNFTLQLAFLKNALDDDLYMTYIELDYTIKWKRGDN